MASERLKRFNYAIGMFGTSIPINMLKTYAAAYYVLGLGLTTPQLALVLSVYTFIDALDNPIYGYLSDRTRTRWGRRRPWLVIGTPLLVLGLIAFFSAPAGLSGNSLLGYAMLFYILTGTIDSLINANYGALFPELFPDEHSRAVTNAMRQAFQLVAMIIAIALTPMVTERLGYSLTAVIYGILGGAVILYMTFTSREETDQAALEDLPRLWDSVRSLVTNRKFWVAGFANAFYSAAMSLVMASTTFYVKYSLGLSPGQTTMLLGAVLIVGIVGVPLWARLIRSFGTMRVWRAALVTLALAFIPLYFATNLVQAVIASVAVGLGFAGVISTMDLVQAKIMDEDTARYNVRREGIISSALGFMNRLNGLFTAGAFWLVFVLFGFQSGDVPGPNPALASRFLIAVVPCTLMVISFGFSFFIDFREPSAELELVSSDALSKE
ncbi:MAG: MFS transporter [Chloroflexi bacterium]|nr:MFS transporter [Chloroflexota bacterium]